VDVNAALASSDVATKSAASPTVGYNPITRQASLMANGSAIWGSNVVWGDTTVWGTTAVWGSNVVWAIAALATNVVWGDSTAPAQPTSCGATMSCGEIPPEGEK